MNANQQNSDRIDIAAFRPLSNDELQSLIDQLPHENALGMLVEAMMSSQPSEKKARNFMHMQTN